VGKPIVLEGDSLQVVNAINAGEPLWSHYGHLVEDTKTILRSMPNWKCCHVRREANGAAHNLAKAAVLYDFDYTWMGETPICIRDVILREFTALFFH
jgi:hypothetical protein